ncbi:MAG: response regulator [Vicinamibacterales bacterium]
MLTDHVLIVDDEAPVRMVLSRWINAIGYETTEADSAETALEEMTARPAAVVFSDVQMPGQGGLWLAGVLRAQFPETAIVLVTGVTTIPATTTMRAGFLAYLTKPFNAREVRSALEKSIIWHAAAVAAGPQPSQTDDEGDQLKTWLDSLE